MFKSRRARRSRMTPRRRRLRRLARGAVAGPTAPSSVSSAKSEARARNETTATAAAGRRRDGSITTGRSLDIDILREYRRQDAPRPRVAPDAAKAEPRVGHDRDGHYQRKNAASNSYDALREGPCSSPHQSPPWTPVAGRAAGAVTRRARTSRACKYAAAARSSVARSMVARRHRGQLAGW